MDVLQVSIRLAGAVVLLAMLAGCGGDGSSDSGGAPPAGLKRTHTQYFSFAHPPGWSVSSRPASTGEKGETVTEAIGPRGTASLPPDVLVGATPHYGSGLSGALQVNELDANVRYPDRRVVSKKDLDVPGAAGAKLIESEVSNEPATGGPATPVRLFDVVAVSKKGTAVNMFIRVPSADVERARVRDIIGSLELIA
jgi:hypothetical protein